jgi:choline dehydrogenase-like flavoprotein
MTEPSVNWGYTSVPQSQLNSQIFPCSRGRGLGGSSCINFPSWVIGHQKDYDRIAELTGDESWRWEGEFGVKDSDALRTYMWKLLESMESTWT